MESDSFSKPNGWNWVPIGDICERVSVGYVSSTREFFCPPGVGVRLVRSQNIRPGRLLLNEAAWVTRDFHDSNPKSQLQQGDVLITRVGANAGDVCIVPEGAGDLHLSSAVYVRPKKEHRKYIELFFRSPLGQNILKTRIVGSVSERINTRDVEALFILLPPSEEEAAIAHILSALDDKIELNRQMNETLEAMSRAIFKSWFVDFDPVRAKAACRDPALPKPIADLFPGSFQDSELGEIPRGWSVGTLENALVLQRGFDLPSHMRTPGIFPVLAASGPSGTHNEFMVKGPGVTTGRSGVLGKVFYVHDNFWPLNTSLWVKDFRHSLPAYAFQLLRCLDFELFNAGSAVPTLNRNHVHNLPILLPPVELIAAFEKFAAANLDHQKQNDEETRTLATLRDTLFPKLISGELRLV